MELNYNRVELCGTVLEAPVLSHVNHGCAFCRFPLSVLRLSGQPDKLQVIAPQPLLDALPVSPGDTVTAACLHTGQRFTAEGRVQSRVYTKNENGVLTDRTAYEVSVMRPAEVEEFLTLPLNTTSNT